MFHIFILLVVWFGLGIFFNLISIPLIMVLGSKQASKYKGKILEFSLVLGLCFAFGMSLSDITKGHRPCRITSYHEETFIEQQYGTVDEIVVKNKVHITVESGSIASVDHIQTGGTIIYKGDTDRMELMREYYAVGSVLDCILYSSRVHEISKISTRNCNNNTHNNTHTAKNNCYKTNKVPVNRDDLNITLFSLTIFWSLMLSLCLLGDICERPSKSKAEAERSREQAQQAEQSTPLIEVKEKGYSHPATDNV